MKQHKTHRFYTKHSRSCKNSHFNSIAMLCHWKAAFSWICVLTVGEIAHSDHVHHSSNVQWNCCNMTHGIAVSPQTLAHIVQCVKQVVYRDCMHTVNHNRNVRSYEHAPNRNYEILSIAAKKQCDHRLRSPCQAVATRHWSLTLMMFVHVLFSFRLWICTSLLLNFSPIHDTGEISAGACGQVRKWQQWNVFRSTMVCKPCIKSTIYVFSNRSCCCTSSIHAVDLFNSEIWRPFCEFSK